MSVRADYLSRWNETTTFVMGDEAAALGALYAGCDFFGGYPITPATEIAEVMARELPKVGGFYVQFEDEVASIAAIIGAAWAGGRTMTATSGPGFSLMQENIGYAVMTETPCVVIDVQRSGPSTGQATKPAQGDLMQARWGTHGDHEIIALSPWSVQECFDLSIEAFHLAERYRTPVIFLMDGAVGHIREPLTFPAYTGELSASRRRAAPGDLIFGGEAVPPMAQIGDDQFVHITGSTHKADGIRDVNSRLVHEELVYRLVDKIASAREALTRVDTRHMEGARVAVASFGATARPGLGAVELARSQGHPAGFLRLINLWPFPGPTLNRELANVDCVLVPEMNLGQLNRELERVVDCPVVPLSKIGGKVHTVGEIYGALMERLS
ncbi:MAG: 2-oxoacid:acceptor oxidoreductase subunit alpha [Acidobacteriota bacterium]